ncbi:DUF5681 domain-containing protein [Methylobacterium brachythecii]|uniref:DUF5681 domain-containing protein n=1 Tax=Methylobacterium brachythecii TaxID=1176177 RepID=A0A7W6AK40_9HYPH|nr:DUF5681 domain-containing protein [Methylobacterium brachythecii]MBB3902730.1 hypothetical protein [Methylobacterium brachythecii]GLS42572.1 hypothetical protein GCM10007884_05570 [Methylobacterium brachythecii]
MPRNRKPPGEYEVGYGKPPEHTRFKPGVSGNPKGRTKGTQDFDAMLHAALAKKVRVTENGRSVKMTKYAILLDTNINKACKGDPRSFREVMHHVGRSNGSGGQAGVANPAAELVFGSEEMAIIARFFERESAANETPDKSDCPGVNAPQGPALNVQEASQ